MFVNTNINTNSRGCYQRSWCCDEVASPSDAPRYKGGIARDVGVADVCATGAKNLGFESYAFSCVEDAILLCL